MNVVGSGKLTKTDDVLLELGRVFDAYLKTLFPLRIREQDLQCGQLLCGIALDEV
jgi:hypothetical protein